MSLSNQDAVTRLTELHSTLNVISQDADNQARLWADVNQQTVQAIDAALQAQGVATVEDLTQKIIAEIGDAEKRADVVQLLADLTPATTFGGMLWDKIKDPVEDVMTIANFIAVGQFANKAWVMNAESWNLRMAQTRAMGAFTTASRARLAANFTNGAIRGVNQGLTAEEIAEIERQTNLDVIDEAAEGEEEDFNEIIDTTAQGVEDAKVAYAAARTDCIVRYHHLSTPGCPLISS
ncbi:hypothetical protein BDV98DRAFT_99902 [Pterulicium gracile]|uniref:Uncharacterized protein n=1 Tax=Pterulicium gracile TaxID=1884261 RepID=A0A5C3QFZ6_9AGAR|nr:hypothetical protein BDV98DRAFT_99902 [Pterula gracilis]